MAISATDPSSVSATSRTSAVPQDDAQSSTTSTQKTASLEPDKTPASADVVNGARSFINGIGAQLQQQLNKPLEQDAGNGRPTKPCPRSKCTADGGPIRGLGGPTTEFA